MPQPASSSPENDPRTEQILDAATEVFAQRGFRGADVQEIADRLSIGKGSIYRRFETKEKLFLAAAERGRQKLQAAIDEAAASLEDPLAKIRAAILTFLTFFDENPALMELVIEERAHFKDRATHTFFDFQDRSNDPWVRRVEELVRAKVLRDLPAQQIMETIAQIIYGAVFVNFFGGRRQSLAQQCDQILDVIFHGVLLTPGTEKHA
jgi:AcrR family transcriptional regulator